MLGWNIISPSFHLVYNFTLALSCIVFNVTLTMSLKWGSKPFVFDAAVGMLGVGAGYPRFDI